MNTIELTDALPKRPNTILIVAKDLYKATKFVLIAGFIFVGVDLSRQGYNLAIKKLEAAKETFISDQVAKSLDTKTLDFDDKRGVAKPATAMSRDELLRALYLLNKSAEDRESTISHLKEILSYE